MPAVDEARAELVAKCRPGYRCRLWEAVEPVGQPNVDVDRHASCADLANCCLSERQFVLHEAHVEAFVQGNGFAPEWQLIIRTSRDDGIANEAAVHDLRYVAGRFFVKGQSAEAEAFCLF